MDFLSSALSTTPASCVVAFLTTLIAWRSLRFTRDYGYLANIPGPAPSSWWKGNLDEYYAKDGWKFHERLYREYGGAVRINLLFGEKGLFISDPLALYHICWKDQSAYEETRQFLVLNSLLLGRSLLSTLGEEHRRQRKMLNPVFSLKHMRGLLPIFYPISNELCDTIEQEVRSGKKEFVDVMDWVSRAALEYIGQGGFGYSFEAFNVQKEMDPLAEAMKKLQPLLAKVAFIRLFGPLAVKFGPPSLRRRILDLTGPGTVKEIAAHTDEIENLSKSILRQKRRALEEGDETVRTQLGKGKDIMSILMQANSSEKLPESELLAHMNTFITAAHDTTSSAIARALHILADHIDAQNRLREEVRNAYKQYAYLHGATSMKDIELDYDSLMGLPYLDAVCRETLRLHPPAPQLDRVTTRDVILPLSHPIPAGPLTTSSFMEEKESKSKTHIREIVLKKGTTIHISILGANRNKYIWGEDADIWRPERWLEPLPESVERSKLPGVYSQTMTFLGGSRACIGFKFAEMELKLALAQLVSRFIFTPGPDVFWAMGPVQHPELVTVEDDSGSEGRPQLPLRVRLVED